MTLAVNKIFHTPHSMYQIIFIDSSSVDLHPLPNKLDVIDCMLRQRSPQPPPQDQAMAGLSKIFRVSVCTATSRHLHLCTYVYKPQNDQKPSKSLNDHNFTTVCPIYLLKLLAGSSRFPLSFYTSSRRHWPLVTVVLLLPALFDNPGYGLLQALFR